NLKHSVTVIFNRFLTLPKSSLTKYSGKLIGYILIFLFSIVSSKISVAVFSSEYKLLKSLTKPFPTTLCLNFETSEGKGIKFNDVPLMIKAFTLSLDRAG